MKVVDLHPEELIDKLNEGSLTLAERERLNAHVAQCSSCRFELAVRADLAADASAFEGRPQLTPPRADARERSEIQELLPAVPREQRALEGPRSVRPRSRRRFSFALLAAALVLSAGGAMAAALTGAAGGRWLGWAREPKPTESNAPHSDAQRSSKPKRAVAVAVAVPVDTAARIAASASSTPAASATVVAPEASTRATAVGGSHPSQSAAIRTRGAQTALGSQDNARPSTTGASNPVPAAAASREAPTDAAALFAEANRARRDGNVDRAVGLYRTLQSRFPSSSESELSRALLAQLLLQRGNPEAALAGFDRYLADDDPVLSAEALVGRARALEQLGKSTQAAAAWRLVQSRFPGSVHARLAATRLAALGAR
ncbi:MAG TPA: tetratricopeptide repeat protein [Polyangiaceae bacterium]|nr:tetratricopeptide repeat protein [Polyangiaceae bacterium]